MPDNTHNDVAELLYGLADALSHLVLREHQILQQEMQQVGSLVDDAVKSLDSDFRTLNTSATLQTKIIDDALQNDLIDKQTSDKLRDIGREIASSTSSTIRVLQFDDIVQQLAGHACERINQMQTLFNGLDKSISEYKNLKLNKDSDLAEYIKQMQREIDRFRVRLEKENPVKQRSMKPGKIELF